MKLLRLKINDEKGFRCLNQGFEIVFSPRPGNRIPDGFNPFVLAGPNGSGKSNLLELLAAIFYHIECQFLNFRPSSFELNEVENPVGFRAEIAIPDAFELEYLIPVPKEMNDFGSNELGHIFINKVPEKASAIAWRNRELFSEEGNPELSNLEVKQLLPEFILGYSSGENETLSLPFFKMRFIHFDEYLEKLKNADQYGDAPEGRLSFLDNELNQAILLCNFLFEDEKTLIPFREEVGIEGLEGFRIIVQHYQTLNPPGMAKAFPQSLVEEESGIFLKKASRVKLTHNLSIPPKPESFSENGIQRTGEGILDKLLKCTTCHFYDTETDSTIMDFFFSDATKEAFKFYFETSLKLFQGLQILLTLNLYSVSEAQKKDLYQSSSLYVRETIPTLPSDERVIRFKDLVLQKKGVSGSVYLKSLSDGEHQFLHSLGLCLLFRNSNSLFLLDEPETHFNPDWRSKFISRLRDCFKTADPEKRQEIFISTHSPFLISDSKPEFVLVFNKTPGGKVEVTRPEYNTLGASINKITMKSFDKRETIGGVAQHILQDLQTRLDKGEDKEDILCEADRLLGDSVEKIFFIKTILDRGENK
ncbi:MAG: restriction system-associated AAA family ATPase [Candidatus Riflebacteria bacterium]|nr:restriction system-associated AAA family ATPase [Candidatus Riflebacteria bacterium]